MNWIKAILVFLVVLFLSDGCVDRLQVDLEQTSNLPIVITGFISDQPGPYEIRVRRSFPIGGSNRYEVPVAVKKIGIVDNLENEIPLSEKSPGVYSTDENSFQGVVGRAYQLHVELLNGKTYQSIPDTIPLPTKIDTVYSKYRNFTNLTGGYEFYFDVFFNTSTNLNNNFYFLWKFRATFKVDTHPELELEQDPKGSTPCDFIGIDCAGCHPCNVLAKCTGLRNVGNALEPRFIRVGPCTCCTCWYSIYNERPILTNYAFLSQGRFENFKVASIKLDDYIINSKIYVDVDQYNLTRQSYLFYKAIQDQKDGATSLFQPPSGKIPTNFQQIAGDAEPINGFFYTASVSQKTIIITKEDVPNGGYPFSYPLRLIKRTCVGVYPNSTTTKPTFWVD